jgi:hypothetical protein
MGMLGRLRSEVRGKLERVESIGDTRGMLRKGRGFERAIALNVVSIPRLPTE